RTTRYRLRLMLNAPDLAAHALGQFPERGHLVAAQFASFVPTDIDFEHDPIINVEEQHCRRWTPHQGALDEGDAAAPVRPQVSMKSSSGEQSVVAARHLAFRHWSGELDNPVLGMHDDRHLAPYRNVRHDIDEC